MKIPKLATVFLLVAGTVAFPTNVEKTEPSKPHNRHSRGNSQSQSSMESYRILFDAGSTGTRIHIFQFKEENGKPKLVKETVKKITPGLSKDANDPNKCADGIKELLALAENTVPRPQWSSTPLVLRATAGLRKLSDEQSQCLLKKVEEVFNASPFQPIKDAASIMKGEDEGISAWITINYLLDHLQSPGQSTVGMLDLGGASTQIAFSPQAKKTSNLPTKEVAVLGHTHKVYSQSYMGLGLMLARLAILGRVEGQPQGSKELVSPCLAPSSKVEWTYDGVDYTVKGQTTGGPIYKSCLKKVEEVLSNVKEVNEAKDKEFYACSAYYYLAADIKAIDKENGGAIKVNDYTVAAEKECNNKADSFLCLDLTYISTLLQKLGFPKDKELQLKKMIKGTDISWALGETLRTLFDVKPEERQSWLTMIIQWFRSLCCF